jgi:site-specific DNA-methyltransferase (adenine-specific)
MSKGKHRGKQHAGGHMLELNTLYNLDCMEGMAQFPDKYFELAIVDPPYGIGVDGQKERVDRKHPQHSRKGHERKGWDSQTPSRAYFDELRRVSKNQIIWGGNYFVEHLQDGHKGWIVWDKGQRGLTMSDCELAYSSFDSPTRIYVLNRVELLLEGTIHPTQKPVKLYEWLLAHYAKPGDKILDTHVGSASSLIACHKLGYDFIGFEIDKDYWQAATDRLEAHRAQQSLFV